MIWQNKEVASLTDDELVSANAKLSEMFEFYATKVNDPKFLKRVGNNIPAINPTFEKLREEINSELAKRELIP